MNSTVPTPSLKRRVSFSLLMLYGLGTILGAGIYVLIGKVAGVAGMYAPIAFLVASVLAGLSSYSFAKLSQRYPRASGEAFYVRQAFSLSWLAPLVGWMVVATGVISSATIARGFTGYLSVYVDWPEIIVMTVLLSALVLLACWGVAESVSVAALITIIELLGLIFVIWMARSYLSDLPMRWPELLPPFEGVIWLSIMLGGFLAFYAFIGFEDMVNMA
ncbi:MAG: amino acid permease, partial [Pseudomonadota bacterium]|nr:amino acid permease [Pseudomonadota bacterium]